MELMAKAEVPEKSLLIDNSRGIKVSEKVKVFFSFFFFFFFFLFLFSLKRLIIIKKI